jgi:hypothetical protein
VLSPAVPAGAIPGRTYARFRCSTAGGLAPTGPAADGEVEDYVIGIVGTDFGDAPASYATQGAGAASHTIDPATTLYLGTCVDTEADGQPNAAANGDDVAVGSSRVGSCFDDEDGVSFTSVLTACQSASVTVTAAAAGVLDAWLDFSGNGSFGDAGEQIFAGQNLVAGANALSYSVPCSAVTATTYARFRFSSAGIATPAGAAADGEVEDYAVNIGPVDFGDAPDSYATTNGAGGPNHGLLAGFSLGPTVDTESEGQPSGGADGDGADEDGVVLPNAGVLVACTAVNVAVTLTNTAGVATPRLDAWIDFDGDGAFHDPRDRIATAVALVAGANNVAVNVPCDARSANTYARFRLSSAGTPVPGGPSADGEVEDYALTTLGLDFGDAPDPSYPTLLASNGARHRVLVSANPTLGASVDTEPNGQPTVAASGDDGNTGDDEDGVTHQDLVPGTEGGLTLSASTGGVVSCWIDFDQNGSFTDAGEQVVTDVVLGNGQVALQSFPVPPFAVVGTAYSRCRISSVGGLGVTGEAADGEIEDHRVTILAPEPALGVAKQAGVVERLGGIDYRVPFSFVVTNYGNVPLSDLQVEEVLAVTFPAPASFAVESLTSPDFAVNPGFDGDADANLLAAGAALAVGASGSIELVVLVNSGGNPGPFYNAVTATALDPQDTPLTDVSQDGDDPDPDADDDPTNDDEPTEILLPYSILEIPTVGEIGLLALGSLLAAAGLGRLRRRSGAARR